MTTRNQTTGQETAFTTPPGADDHNYTTAVGGAVEVFGLTACNQYPRDGAFYSNISMSVNGTPVGPGSLGWLTTVRSVTPSCSLGVIATVSKVNLHHNPSITASGGLMASCLFCTPYITAVTATGSNVITVKDNSGHTGTITLAGGVSASGGLTASCTFCTPRVKSITATDGNTITIQDNGGHSGTLTLTGARANGGFTDCGLSCGTVAVNGVTTANGYIVVRHYGGTNATLFLRP